MKNFLAYICWSLTFLALFAWEGLSVRSAELDEDGLVVYEVIDLIQSKSIPKSLTGVPGDLRRGESLMIAREKGNCLACHQFSVFEEKAKKDRNSYGDMGEIGPSLDGVASRYNEGQLRILLVDAKLLFPETMMPAFYKVKGFHRVGKSFVNKPILEAQEVEDILSFLLTMK